MDRLSPPGSSLSPAYPGGASILLGGPREQTRVRRLRGVHLLPDCVLPSAKSVPSVPSGRPRERVIRDYTILGPATFLFNYVPALAPPPPPRGPFETKLLPGAVHSIAWIGFRLPQAPGCNLRLPRKEELQTIRRRGAPLRALLMKKVSAYFGRCATLAGAGRCDPGLGFLSSTTGQDLATAAQTHRAWGRTRRECARAASRWHGNGGTLSCDRRDAATKREGRV